MYFTHACNSISRHNYTVVAEKPFQRIDEVFRGIGARYMGHDPESFEKPNLEEEDTWFLLVLVDVFTNIFGCRVEMLAAGRSQWMPRVEKGKAYTRRAQGDKIGIHCIM